MAELGASGFSQDTLFVSPDNLMIDHELNSCFQDTRQQPQAYGHPSNSAQQARSVSFAEQSRPNLSLPRHSLSEWPEAPFLSNLPPTPLSPFRPLRALTEDERLAFPCLGGPEDCWNSSLCPKHRQYPDTPGSSSASSSRHSESSQTTASTPASATAAQQLPSTNPRRRSCPASEASDLEQDRARIKIKRNSADPEQASELHRPPHHRSLSSRTSLSRGRVPHNLVERRYRDNLNHQIEALRLVLPNLKDAVPTDVAAENSFDHPRMPSKAMIISTAATYIKDLENERQRLISANEALQDQVGSLQKLVRANGGIEGLGVVQYLNAMRLAGRQLGTPP